MKNIVIKSLGMIMAFSLVISCETLELESLIENPNALGLSSASPDFVLNEMQLDFRNLNRTIGGGVESSMRMTVLASTYNAVTSTTAMNTEWTNLYNFNANFNVLESIAEEDGLGFHLGMAQIMKATLFVNVVDLIGEAVYTEANDPTIPKPSLDSGESIYTAMYDLIDEGIANLKSGAKRPVNDLYYDGNAAAWVRFANSFKIKMLLTTRLVTAADSKTKIDAILAGGEYIQNNSQDMEFQYGVTAVVNESRHPLMSASYTTGASGYRPNNLISYMKDSSAVQDPRLRYYFYRQTLRDPVGTELTCAGTPNFTFCYTGDGYWGRDHGDDSAAPADGLLRTVYGAYPAAGAYDNDQGEPITVVSNLGGDGIHPIMLSSWVQFMLAESALKIGVTGNARTYLENGLRQHIDKVINFQSSETGHVAPASQVNDYVNEVLTDYDAADEDGKMDIIAREWYIASYTNGIDPFNTYRRTGYPSFLMEPIIDLGPFMRSFLYPANELNVNENITQKSSNQIQVFWDTNPAGFIN